MKRWLSCYPLLYALFPVLSLYDHNIGDLTLGDLLLPLALVLAGTGALWGVFRLLFRHTAKAGLAASLFVTLFFSYGHAALVGGPSQSNAIVDVQVLLSQVFLLAFLVGVFALLRTQRQLGRLQAVAAVIAIALVLPPLLRIGAYEVKRAHTRQVLAMTKARGEVQADPGDRANLPNIYYIILDSYGREDVLRDDYHYDNADFIAYLRDKGFYVSDQARANYLQTVLSLASSLNYTYLDDVAATVGTATDDRQPLHQMMAHSRTRAILAAYGYSTVAYATGYQLTELTEADHFIEQYPTGNTFSGLLAQCTPLRGLVKEARRAKWLRSSQQNRVLFALEHLPSWQRKPGPFFVFAHIVCPHPPYVFGPQGEAIDPDKPFVPRDPIPEVKSGRYSAETVYRYPGQLHYLNSRVKLAIDSILSEARRPTIIVLQADHGPCRKQAFCDLNTGELRERAGILNAVYLPDRRQVTAQDFQSPVNTFPTLLNWYFGTKLPLQPNRTFFSTNYHPYDFTEVTDIVEAERSSERHAQLAVVQQALHMGD